MKKLFFAACVGLLLSGNCVAMDVSVGDLWASYADGTLCDIPDGYKALALAIKNDRSYMKRFSDLILSNDVTELAKALTVVAQDPELESGMTDEGYKAAVDILSKEPSWDVVSVGIDDDQRVEDEQRIGDDS